MGDIAPVALALERIPFFRHLDERELEGLARTGRRRACGAGETIFREGLAAGSGTPIGDRGDTYVVDGNQLLVEIAGDEETAAARHVIVGYAPPPEMLVPLIHSFARSFGALWKKVAAREAVPV